MRLVIPEPDQDPWPSLGAQVCDFIEANLVHGPGDVLGDPVVLTDEIAEFIYRAYEVYPKGHPRAGRRRFKRAVLSRRKGVGKTEIAAWIAIVEMDPNGPVRCSGFDAAGQPVGRPIRDPYIPMVATTEDQTEDLAYAAVYEILARSRLVDDYDIGLEKITHIRAPGVIQALASAPSARDGARTTFQHFDETHLFAIPKLIKTHETMLRNIPKRKDSDAWSLDTTTMYGPGEKSIAELTHLYAEAIQLGREKDPRLLFDHRQADEKWDLTKRRQLRAAIEEASGDAIAFADVDAIMSMFGDSSNDENLLRRYWLNQPRRSTEHWGPSRVWPELAHPRRKVADGAEVVLAFDGSYSRDSTALVGCTVAARPHIFEVKTWERPPGQAGWRVSREDVEATLEAAMGRWRVLELAPDPPGWHREVEDWEHRWGDAVVRFETWQAKRMGPACDDFEQGVRDRELTHDGSEVIARHLQNAVVAQRGSYTVITKDDKDSPHKIDAGVAAVVAYHRAMWRFQNPTATREPFFSFV